MNGRAVVLPAQQTAPIVIIMCICERDKSGTESEGLMPCRFFARPLEMLRIYRFAGGLFAVLAVWIAALRSDLQPSRHIAVLLVSSRFRGLPY